MVKRWLKVGYPKLLILTLVIILSYFLFKQPVIQSLFSNLGSLNLLGSFIGGILLSFGFTTPLAVGYFVTSNPNSIFFLALIGGLGGALGDLIIFKTIKLSFMDEFNRLKRTSTMKEMNYLIDNYLGHKIKYYLLYLFADFVLISPLPDELGVPLLAGLTKIKSFYLTLLSFVLHTIGIYILLSI